MLAESYTKSRNGNPDIDFLKNLNLTQSGKNFVFKKNNSTKPLPRIAQIKPPKQGLPGNGGSVGASPKTPSDFGFQQESQNISRLQASRQSYCKCQTAQNLDIKEEIYQSIDINQKTEEAKSYEKSPIELSLNRFDYSNNDSPVKECEQKQEKTLNSQSSKRNLRIIQQVSIEQFEKIDQQKNCFIIKNNSSIKNIDINEIYNQNQQLDQQTPIRKIQKIEEEITEMKLEFQREQNLLGLYSDLWNQSSEKIKSLNNIIAGRIQEKDVRKRPQPQNTCIIREFSKECGQIQVQSFTILNELSAYISDIVENIQPERFQKKSQKLLQHQQNVQVINEKNQNLIKQIEEKMKFENDGKYNNQVIQLLRINEEITVKISFYLDEFAKSLESQANNSLLKQIASKMIQSIKLREKYSSTITNVLQQIEIQRYEQEQEFKEPVNVLQLQKPQKIQLNVVCIQMKNLNKVCKGVKNGLNLVNAGSQTQDILVNQTNQQNNNNMIVNQVQSHSTQAAIQKEDLEKQKAEADIQKQKDEVEKFKAEVNEKYQRNVIQIFDDVQQELKLINDKAENKLKHQTTLEMYRELLEEWQKICSASDQFQKELKNCLENLTDQTQQQNEKHSQDFQKYNEIITSLEKKIHGFIQLLTHKMNLDKDNKGKLYQEAIIILTFNIKILKQTQALISELMKQLQNKNQKIIEQQMIIKKVEEQNKQFNEFSLIVSKLLQQIEFQEKLAYLKQNDDQQEIKVGSQQLFSCIETSMKNFQQIFSQKEDYVQMIKNFRGQDAAAQKRVRQMITEMSNQVAALQMQFLEGQNHFVIYQLQSVQ